MPFDDVVQGGNGGLDDDLEALGVVLQRLPVVDGLQGKPDAQVAPVAFQHFHSTDHVVPTPDSGIRASFDALVERLGVRPKIVAEVDDMAMLPLVTRARQGLAVVPPIVGKDELDGGSLVEVWRLPALVEPFVALTVPRRLRHPLLSELLPAEVDLTVE